MGSITSINPHPNTWPVLDIGDTLKTTNEPVVTVIYGSCDDYPGMSDLSIYMRKSVYNKCLSGEYLVSARSSLTDGLILTDQKRNPIPAIAPGIVY